MTLITDVFPNLRTPKNVVRSMSKNSCFRGQCEKPDGKRHFLVNIFKKEMTLIADVFPKLRNPKSVVRSMS